MELFRISATAGSPNYLPQFLAEDLGYFREEGVAVETTVPDPWTGVLDNLDKGEADAVLGGAWLPAIYYGGLRRYKIFAQLNGRYPLALLARKPVPGNNWEWLLDRVVIVPSSGGAAAYMFLTGLLREEGLDPSKITFLRDLSHEMFAELFRGGLGDALVTYMMNARKLIESGEAHLVASLDMVSGPMPNSVYYTTDEILERRANAVAGFTRALQRAVNWLAANGVANARVRRLLARLWPNDEQEQLQGVVGGFHRNGLWSDGVCVDKEALDRWQRFLIEGHLLRAPVPYAKLVDERPLRFATGQAILD